MPLVTTTEMFKKAYEGGYAIGAFNVNNMEIVQGITEAAAEEKAPIILQVSAGARKYAKHIYLTKLVEAAVADTGLPIALHLDHGADFEICKSCIDGGFTSVMIDGSHHDYEDNVALTKKVVEYAHAHGVVVEAELGQLAGIAGTDVIDEVLDDLPVRVVLQGVQGVESLRIIPGGADLQLAGNGSRVVRRVEHIVGLGLVGIKGEKNGTRHILPIYVHGESQILLLVHCNTSKSKYLHGSGFCTFCQPWGICQRIC